MCSQLVRQVIQSSPRNGQDDADGEDSGPKTEPLGVESGTKESLREWHK